MRTARGLLLTSSLLLAACGRDAQDCTLALTCPEYADGGVPVNPECAGDPMGKDAGPKDGCGIFVSPSAAAGGDGSADRPLSSLQSAIARAVLTQKPVFACAKEFAEAISVPAGVTIFGGLDCDAGWIWTAGKRTTVKPAAGGKAMNEIALKLAPGDGTTRIEDVDVIAPDGAAAGASSIAVLVDGVAASFARCDFTAGNGAPGGTGADGAATDLDGQGGAVGIDICSTGAQSPGATGPMKACSTGGSSTGGDGGDGGGLSGSTLLAAGAGKDGSPADSTMPAAGKGGAGQDTMVCAAGLTGTDGAAGDPGKGADQSMLGSISADGFTGAAGKDGSDGKPGQGGGGGGGAKGGLAILCNGVTVSRVGASGGSGGTGGCGGQHGSGGKPGGSSIALVSLGAMVTLESVNLTAKDGGAGGQGGAGQAGGNSGLGNNGGMGAGLAKNACRGGDGGYGGEGGPGGGGRGGHSIGIAYTGSAPKGGTITTAAMGAMGGAGGLSATMMGGQGAAGVAVKVQPFE
jgi:hypothetical protein